MAAPKLQSETFPIFYVGDHFLPIEGLRKWVRDQENVELHAALQFDEVRSLAVGHEFKVIIMHVANAHHNKGVIRVVEALADDFVQMNAFFFVITGSNNRTLKRLLGMHQWVEILPSEVDSTQLRSKVAAKLRTLRDRASTLKRNVAKSESTESSQSGAGGIYLIKGGASSPVLEAQVEAPLPDQPTPLSPDGPPRASEPFADKPVFDPIHEWREICSLVEECRRTKAPLSIFDAEMSKRGTVEVVGLDPLSNVIKFKQGLGVKGGGLEALMKGLDGGVLGNFNLRRGRIFFRAPTLSVEGSEGTMPLPEVMFEVQRRTNLRLPLSEVMRATTSMEGEVSGRREFEIFDISSGGLCLLVDEANIKDWKPASTRLKDIEFKVGSRNLRVGQGEVRHLSVFDKTEGKVVFRVGLQFVNLSVRDHCFINAFIYKESQKYLEVMFDELKRES